MRTHLEPGEIRLVLLRHGETEANVGCRYTGWSETALTPRGREQAERVAARLAPLPVGTIYASDLGRAVETASIVAAPHGLSIAVDPRLRERNYGLLEGMEFGAARERFPEAFPEPDRYATDFALPAGESVVDVRRRVAAFVDEASRREAGKTVVVVTHAGAVRAFLGVLIDLPSAAIRGACCDNAGLSSFRRTWRGWQLELWNDTAHLDGQSVD